MKWFGFGKPTIGVIRLGALLRLYPAIAQEVPEVRITYTRKSELRLRLPFCSKNRVSFSPDDIFPCFYLILVLGAIVYFCGFILFCKHLVADLYITVLMLSALALSFPSQINYFLYFEETCSLMSSFRLLKEKFGKSTKFSIFYCS